MQIKRTVEKMHRRYLTNDPFDIAQQLGIIVLFEQLGSVRGYYSRSYRQKVIHINYDMTHNQQSITCAHELGHSILHPALNTPFLRENTLFSVNKLETQANHFMVQLLIPDHDVREYIQYGYTNGQIATIYGIPEYLVEYKVQTMLAK
jgi:Zn-dependent peptidase ImmA (M78 family)